MVMQTSRRKILRAAAVSGALAAACGTAANTHEGEDSKPSSAGLVTVEWIGGLNAQQVATAPTMLQGAFNERFPRLKMAIQNLSPRADQLAPLVAGGSPPDVVYRGGGVGPRYFQAKLIQDITAKVKRDKYNTGVFVKSSFDWACTWRGAVVCLPIHYGGSWPVMGYNRDVFRANGLTEPPSKWGDTSWNAETWLRALQRTTRVDGEGKTVSLGINLTNPNLVVGYWTPLWKTSWISEDLKTITSDSPQMIEAMEYIVGLIAKHQVVAATSARLSEAFGDPSAEKAFLAGRMGMISGGGALAGTIAQAARDGAPVALAPLPTFKTAGSMHTYENNGLIVGAKHPDEGFTLMKWLADTPNWAISRGNPPARLDNFDAWAESVFKGVESKIRLEVFKDSIKFAVNQDRLNQLPNADQIADEVITPAFAKLWAGQANVATTLREIKGPMQALVPKEL